MTHFDTPAAARLSSLTMALVLTFAMLIGVNSLAVHDAAGPPPTQAAATAQA